MTRNNDLKLSAFMKKLGSKLLCPAASTERVQTVQLLRMHTKPSMMQFLALEESLAVWRAELSDGACGLLFKRRVQRVRVSER
jgi:hypothetical protein